MEFVSRAEVLTAITELRRIRATDGSISYIGISGYPISVLCDLAEYILKETGEPLDAVMSYANYTLQNRRLLTEGLERLKKAGVGVVPNASILGMGLLRRSGVPCGALGNWHPAPEELRQAIWAASEFCDSKGEKLEKVAIRWALETWAKSASSVGSRGDPASGLPWKRESIEAVGGSKLGVSVLGVSTIEELDETMRVWRSILDGLEGGKEKAVQAGRWEGDHEWSLTRREEVQELAKGVQAVLGSWLDFAWDSPDKDFVRGQKKTSSSSVAEPQL